jgi:hypothetical protein
LKAVESAAGQVDGRRTLAAADYFSLHLFNLLNPIVSSRRGLCVASRFRNMRQVCQRPVSPGSFSEAQHLFEPELLGDIIRELAARARGTVRFGDERVRQAVATLTLVDGTVLRAVNRMAWAAPSVSTCTFRPLIKSRWPGRSPRVKPPN